MKLATAPWEEIVPIGENVEGLMSHFAIAIPPAVPRTGIAATAVSMNIFGTPTVRTVFTICWIAFGSMASAV
jgi:hypothetical protein